MGIDNYIGHIITLTGMLWAGSVVVIRWLLMRRDERIADLEKEAEKIDATHARAIEDLKKAHEAAIVAAVAGVRVDVVERMGHLATNCAKDLALGLQRLETVQSNAGVNFAAHMDKWQVDIAGLQRQLNEVKQDLRAAQRILGRYEVLNGRNDER